MASKSHNRTSSEPAKKSRRSTQTIEREENHQASRPLRTSGKKDTMGDTRRSKGSSFHPNMNTDTNVLSFVNEKPGTSDINQPSNRKIRVNRKLQRNGTTDTGAFRSSYYNKIRNDDYINGQSNADPQQEFEARGGGFGPHGDTIRLSSDVPVPTLSSVHSPKRGKRVGDQNGLSTTKSKRVKNRVNGSTIDGFESMNASALSNERLRMATYGTNESSYQPNYGGRSNISEINEADFNLKSDYSAASPKTNNGQLPSIRNQMLSENL